MTHPVLSGERITLRRLVHEDLPRLLEIVHEPGVAEWWTGYDVSRLRADTFETPDVTSFAIELAGELIGLIMYSEETDPYYKSAGIDITLAAAHLGRGLGPDALRTMARYLFEVRGHHRITIDPAAANVRAISAYRKVGFKPVGVMRAYEMIEDGSWRDALLMDLLEAELR